MVGGSVFAVLIMIDCIMDIVRGTQYYDVCIEYDYIRTDEFYIIKSLISLVTVGFARIVYLLLVHPILRHQVVSDMKKKLSAGYPLPPNRYYYSRAKIYHYNKYIDKLKKKGAIVSNKETVDEETNRRREKLEGMYPQNRVAKLADKFTGDKAAKARREEAAKKLFGYGPNAYAYVSTSVYQKYPQVIMEAMSTRGRLSLSDIIRLEEFKPFMLPFEMSKNAPYEWIEFFVVQALQPLVNNGVFTDEELNDEDVFDNHVYWYVNSKKPLVVINCDDDPLLALD